MSKLGLCIGINNYPGTQNDLSGCVNDANDWEDALKRYGFAVKKILDRKATKAGIISAMKTVLKKAVKGDLVVFQYSGHGSYVPDENGDEPDGTDECICPYDIMTKGPLTDDELFTIYDSKEKGVRLVVISDSCNSGTVARFSNFDLPASTNGINPPRRKVRFLPPSTFLPANETTGMGRGHAIRASSPPGRYAGLLFAACQDAEYSYDAWFNDRANGAFTYVALDRLKKLKSTATYMDWYQAIKRVLPSQQYPQSPNLYGSSSMKKWKLFE